MQGTTHIRPGLLRPRKINGALRRRWFEHLAPRIPLAPAPDVGLLGSDYGGWIVPRGLIGRDWLCYCVGAGGDVSFDLELARRYGARVRSFDAVEGFVQEARESAAGEPLLSVHHAAIAICDGPLRMQRSHDPISRSVSSAGLYDSSDFDVLPGRTITSLMAELGDARIDLLKLDIEGAEYEVVPTLDLPALGVQLFGVQLHHCGSVRQARDLVAMVCDQGYQPVAIRPVMRVVFARRDLLESAGEAAAREPRGAHG